jgi:hypothetical protein
MERKEIERNRRLHMKSLCFKLASLIPKEHCSNSKVYMHCSLLWYCVLT